MEIAESQYSMEPTQNVPPPRRTFRYLLLCAVLAIMVLLALTVWPTLYRYEKLTAGQVTTLVRINRITGSTEEYRALSGEWRPVKRPAAMRPLPSNELRKITSSSFPFTQSGRPGVSGMIYNGSNWVVRELTIKVTARMKAAPNSKDGTWTRLYRVPDLNIPPLGVKSFSIVVLDKENFEWEWMAIELAEARGHRDR